MSTSPHKRKCESSYSDEEAYTRKQFFSRLMIQHCIRKTPSLDELESTCIEIYSELGSDRAAWKHFVGIWERCEEIKKESVKSRKELPPPKVWSDFHDYPCCEKEQNDMIQLANHIQQRLGYLMSIYINDSRLFAQVVFQELMIPLPNSSVLFWNQLFSSCVENEDAPAQDKREEDRASCKLVHTLLHSHKTYAVDSSSSTSFFYALHHICKDPLAAEYVFLYPGLFPTSVQDMQRWWQTSLFTEHLKHKEWSTVRYKSFLSAASSMFYTIVKHRKRNLQEKVLLFLTWCIEFGNNIEQETVYPHEFFYNVSNIALQLCMPFLNPSKLSTYDELDVRYLYELEYSGGSQILQRQHRINCLFRTGSVQQRRLCITPQPVPALRMATKEVQTALSHFPPPELFKIHTELTWHVLRLLSLWLPHVMMMMEEEEREMPMRCLYLHDYFFNSEPKWFVFMDWVQTVWLNWYQKEARNPSSELPAFSMIPVWAFQTVIHYRLCTSNMRLHSSEDAHVPPVQYDIDHKQLVCTTLSTNRYINGLLLCLLCLAGPFSLQNTQLRMTIYEFLSRMPMEIWIGTKLTDTWITCVLHFFIHVRTTDHELRLFWFQTMISMTKSDWVCNELSKQLQQEIGQRFLLAFIEELSTISVELFHQISLKQNPNYIHSLTQYLLVCGKNLRIIGELPNMDAFIREPVQTSLIRYTLWFLREEYQVPRKVHTRHLFTGSLLQLFIRCCRCKSFRRAVRLHDSYNASLFSQALDHAIRSEANRETFVKRSELEDCIEKLGLLDEECKLSMESDQDADERFLDNLLYTLMTDPVQLGPLGAIVDRSTAMKCIHTNGMNPFTQTPLTEKDLIELPDLRAEIHAWKGNASAKR